jgi:crossover junction endodeoxyribonuclease RuvC
MSQKIFGLDPGSRVAGFGVLEVRQGAVKYVDHGIINLMSFSENFADRIFFLGEEIQKLLALYQPQDIVIEKVFLGKNVDSAFKLGHARGVVLCEARRYQAHVHEYAAREVKKGVTGRGSAEKEEVQSVLHSLLKIPVDQRKKAFDATDALALAFFHVQKQEQSRLLGRMREI